MKPFFTVFSLLIVSMAFGQSEKYLKTMEASVNKLDTASSLSTFTMLANNFERIANAETNQWLAYYYAGYCNVIAGFMSRDVSKTDIIADKADRMVHLADSLSPKNSENLCLMSMINSSRIMVDPQTRGMKYGILSGQQIAMAKLYNAENPRPYLLEAQSKLYTPEQWGGGKEVAMKSFTIGKEKMANFKPETSIHPRWGQALVKMLEDQMK